MALPKLELKLVDFEVSGVTVQFRKMAYSYFEKMPDLELLATPTQTLDAIVAILADHLYGYDDISREEKVEWIKSWQFDDIEEMNEMLDGLIQKLGLSSKKKH